MTDSQPNDLVMEALAGGPSPSGPPPPVFAPPSMPIIQRTPQDVERIASQIGPHLLFGGGPGGAAGAAAASLRSLSTSVRGAADRAAEALDDTGEAARANVFGAALASAAGGDRRVIRSALNPGAAPPKPFDASKLDALAARSGATLSELADSSLAARGAAPPPPADTLGAILGGGYEEATKAVRAAVADPGAASGKLSAVLGGLRLQDPQLADQLGQTLRQQLAYLGSILPEERAAPFGGAARGPSDVERDRFLKGAAAVFDPTRLLREVAADRVSPETVKAVSTAHPEAYAQMQSDVLSRAAELGELSYSKRLALAAAFGMQTDPSLNPGFVAVMQSNIKVQEAQRAAARSPSSSVPKASPTTAQRLAGGLAPT